MILYVILTTSFDRFGSQRPGGGIGRHAGFRYLWPQGRGSSSLLLGTNTSDFGISRAKLLHLPNT